MILFFLKYPEAGRVKTRLAEEIGGEAAAALYRCFVRDMLAGLQDAGPDFRLCYHPPERGPDMKSWLGAAFQYVPQEGADLGERMLNAFRFAFGQGFPRVAVVGSDLPDLPFSIFREALEALGSREAVLGPALDGGYYLIGFRRDGFCPEVFEKVPWGSDAVLGETLTRLRSQGRQAHILPAWPDVDDLEGLKEFALRAGCTGSSDSATMAYVSEKGILG